MGYKLDEAIQIFESIKNVSGRIEKEKILKENKNNTLFRDMLNFLYNPFITTGLSAKKFNKNVSENVFVVLSNITEAMNYLKQNNTGKDKDIMAIQMYIKTVVPQHAEFLEQFFTKEYKCGITAKTINKVYGKGTIPEFNVMLAKKFEEEEHKIKGEFYATLKLDGIRCLAIKENGSTKFFTRQGQPILDMVELEEQYKAMPDDMVYDGEILLDDKNNHYASDELFRITQKVVRKDGVKEGLNHILFDVIPLGEFINGKSKNTYEKRRVQLELLGENLTEELNRIKILPSLYVGSDKMEIFKLLDKVVSENQEGLMVNSANGYYVTKRTDNLLKVKKMHTVDLRVIGYEEGTGKNVGQLGALIVDYKGYSVKVGSGYTDEEREYIWLNRDDILGRVIEVQYFEESTNEKGALSLRFPVFKGVREDGKGVSYY